MSKRKGRSPRKGRTPPQGRPQPPRGTGEAPPSAPAAPRPPVAAAPAAPAPAAPAPAAAPLPAAVPAPADGPDAPQPAPVAAAAPAPPSAPLPAVASASASAAEVSATPAPVVTLAPAPPAVPAAPPGSPARTPEAAAGGAPALSGLLRPRWRRVDVAVAALLGLLGFAVAVQVRSTQDDGLLASARQEDLVRILDDLSNRSDRLRQETGALTAARERLTTGTDRDRAALEEARRRAQVLGVLAGTVPAEGPGVVLTLTDPTGEVGADDLLDALQELRDAGAEVVQIEGAGGTGPVRVVASTSFLERDGGVEVDEVLLRQPYVYTVVGDPPTLAAALDIPGGVTDSVEQQGGSVGVDERERVVVGALRPLERPRYARPADEPAD